MIEQANRILLSYKDDLLKGQLSPCILLACHACCKQMKLINISEQDYQHLLNSFRQVLGPDFNFADHQTTDYQRVRPGKIAPRHNFSFDECVNLSAVIGSEITGCIDYVERIGACRKLRPASVECNDCRTNQGLLPLVMIQ